MDTKALDFRELPRKLLESALRGIAGVLLAIVLVLSLPTLSRIQANTEPIKLGDVEVSSPPPGPPSHEKPIAPLSINRDEEPRVKETGRNPVLRL